MIHRSVRPWIHIHPVRIRKCAQLQLWMTGVDFIIGVARIRQAYTNKQTTLGNDFTTNHHEIGLRHTPNSATCKSKQLNTLTHTDITGYAHCEVQCAFNDDEITLQSYINIKHTCLYVHYTQNTDTTDTIDRERERERYIPIGRFGTHDSRYRLTDKTHTHIHINNTVQAHSTYSYNSRTNTLMHVCVCAQCVYTFDINKETAKK